jgi:hypothetical protein
LTWKVWKLTSQSGSKIPLKKAAGLNKAFFSDYKYNISYIIKKEKYIIYRNKEKKSKIMINVNVSEETV